MHGEAEFDGFKSASVLEFSSGVDLLHKLSRGGHWFVVADFEGRIRGWRFESVEEVESDAGTTRTTADPFPTSSNTAPRTHWTGPDRTEWSSSHSKTQYMDAVSRTRHYIADGEVYQANICRILSAKVETPMPAYTLAAILAQGNPAPFLGYVEVHSNVPEQNVWLASASPELFFSIEPHAHGATITSSPIKGTAKSRDGLSQKDEAENVMITDLVRNDISPICRPGSVGVRDFLSVQEHPGLVHLVSTVEGEIEPETLTSDDFWIRTFAALFQPGSVSGAPKSSALRIISELESHHRGPYCGGFGWINGDTQRARLAVGIRSFWWEQDCPECMGPALHFGTGAGITWGSDPEHEWLETELKASRLVALASGEEPQ